MLVEKEHLMGHRQQLADHYLTKITTLQEQLNTEEQKLLELLREYGTEILPEPEAAFQVSKTD